MGSSSKDVRVRLSAEGQAEVIAAFQKMSSEGKKAGVETSEAMKELNNQLKDVGKTLIGGLGITLIAEKFTEFFKSTLEGAENLTRLSKQTGLSTDAIQGMQRAARETGVAQEVVNAGLAKFTVAVGKAEIGSKQSAAALSDLGISVKDFSKLKPDEQLALVAAKLSGIPDPARRARDEVALFGRAGVELDQTLVAVGKEGFEPFIQHLKDIGIFLDTDAIASLKSANESFRNLGDTIKGLATQFLVGLVPGIQAATDELGRATNSDGLSGLKRVGELVGEVFRAVVNALEHTGNNVAALIVKTQIFFTTLKDQAKNILDPAEVKRLAQQSAAAIAEVQAENDRRNKEADDRQNAKLPAPVEAPTVARTGDGAAGAAAETLAKARLSLLEARLDNELKLYNAHAALVKETDKQAYDAGQISLTEYYDRRAALTNQQADKEIAILKAKRSLAAATPVDINDPVGEITKKKQLEALDNQIALEQLQRTAELSKNTEEEGAAQRKLYEDTLKSEEQLLTIAGKKIDAAKVKLGLDLLDLDAELKKAGVQDAPRAQAIATVAQQGGAKIDFDSTSAKAQADLAQLTAQEKAFQLQVETGQMFSIAAAQKTVEAQKAMLPALEADAAAMMNLAKATGNAEDIQKAEAYKEKIDQLKASTDKVGQSWAQVNQGLESAAGAGINKFLTDAVSGTKTLKQSFVDMGLAMLQTLEQIAIKALETQALKSIFGAALFSGGGSVSTPGFASGGHIRGAGTGTSDSIPARLSDGEFVVNAKSTAQPGVLPILAAINSGSLKGVNGPTRVPAFAAGGQVGGRAMGTSNKIVNVLDPSLLGDHLATSAGESAVLNVISRNPSRVRSDIG
jgi:hypothetical protein